MRNDGGPAFPIAAVLPSVSHANGATTQIFYQAAKDGMSLRDYFAAAALPGVQAALLKLAEGGNTTWSAESSHAEVAYKFADALLAERDKP